MSTAAAAAPTPIGYLYCFSNPSMPGILKVGMTLRTPEERLAEANRPDTFKPPTNYRLEFAKRVTDPRAKEATLHGLLASFAIQVNKNREFFRVPVDEVRRFFNLMDGLWWEETELDEEELGVDVTAAATATTDEAETKEIFMPAYEGSTRENYMRSFTIFRSR
jgi:hypothetical protein